MTTKKPACFSNMSQSDTFHNCIVLSTARVAAVSTNHASRQKTFDLTRSSISAVARQWKERASSSCSDISKKIRSSPAIIHPDKHRRGGCETSSYAQNHSIAVIRSFLPVAETRWPETIVPTYQCLQKVTQTIRQEHRLTRP